MDLVHDYMAPMPGSGGRGERRGGGQGGGQGRYRIRLYLPQDPGADLPVVVCTQAAGEPFAQSITNEVQTIAAEVIAGNQIAPPVVWIEHYQKNPHSEHGKEGNLDTDTFDLVTFSDYEVRGRAPYLGQERRWIGEPSWQRLDRATVETLVGDKL